MARINIEQSLHTDARFDELKVKMGSRFAAMGALIYAWSVAQEYFLINGGKIPLSEWEKQRLPNEIIDVGLATRCDEFVTMSGVEKQFAWLKQRSQAGRKNIEEFNQRRRTAVNDRTSSYSSSFSKRKTPIVPKGDINHPFIKIWNELANGTFPLVEVLNKSRAAALARCASMVSIDDWKLVVQWAVRDEWLTGRKAGSDGKPFTGCTIDTIMRESKFVGYLERAKQNLVQQPKSIRLEDL